MDSRNKKSKRRPKNRANKIHLVFDETKRREFLTGFRKRKLLRKKQAQENFEKELKEERKRLKADAKESYKKLVVSSRDIPELENLLREEYEEDDVTVKVVELNTNDIAKQNNWIGLNQPKYNEEEQEEASSNEDTKEEIPGMELKTSSKKVKLPDKKKFQNEKQIKKELKKQATKSVQKSKVFQKKNKLERQKQKKQSFKLKKQKEFTRNKTRGRRKK
ncbi:nucleolar protein 12-like [Sitophilus oryzae]|uniref:Nucleolar protein 12 n=1 Tax=Sitophilus oryzae TaxID=7048 RepID=A0A6J2XHT9_SITOR|nr:nucleolar protein 12-like [Sitophilus oryzae]